MINPPIYRLTTAVSDIDQTNINRDIRDGNWLSNFNRGTKKLSGPVRWGYLRPVQFLDHLTVIINIDVNINISISAKININKEGFY